MPTTCLLLSLAALAILLPRVPTAAEDPAVFTHGDCDDTGRCYPEIRIGALAGPSASGQLFAFAEGRINTPSPRSTRILLKRSSDYGRSWSTRASVAAYVPNGTSGNPSPSIMDDGRTLLLAFQHVTTAAHPQYSAFVTRSTDDGATFSVPRNITAQVKGRYLPQQTGQETRWAGLPATNWWDVGPAGGVVDRSGRLVQCMNEEDPPVRDGGAPWVFTASTVDGAAWSAGSRVALFGDGSGECQIARAGPDGAQLVMLARSQRPGTAPMGDDVNGTVEHAVLFSTDGGQHWSSPTRLRDIPGPNCEASIVSVAPAATGGSSDTAQQQQEEGRSRNWTLIATAPSNTMVHDDKGGLLRAGLAMYASEDALSWRRVATIDANASAYSSLLVLPAGKSSSSTSGGGGGIGAAAQVLCMYEAGHGHTHQAPYLSIRLARLPVPH
jgi:hypothetical protein